MAEFQPEAPLTADAVPVRRPAEPVVLRAPTPPPLAPVQRRTPGAADLSSEAFLSRPAPLQRAVATPVLEAAGLRRAHTDAVQAQRASVQRQVEDLQANLPPNAAEQALQRQQAAGTKPGLPTAFQAPGRPRQAGDWAGLFAYEMGTLTPDAQGLYPGGAAKAIQRRASDGLVTSARTSTLPPVQRQADLGQALASLQRQPLGGLVVGATLARLPAAERPAIQRALDAGLQRFAAKEQQDAQVGQLHALQRQLDGLETEDDGSVLSRIQAQRGGGEALPADVQRQLAQGLNIPGVHLAQVRVHAGDQGHRIARSVGAVAATVGHDIFFTRNSYDPHSPKGLKLAAHEVTHTWQQARGLVPAGIDPDAGLEREAQQAGEHFARQSTRRPRTKAATASLARGQAGRAPSLAVQRRAAQDPKTGQPETAVKALGVIKHLDGANLHGQPNASSPSTGLLPTGAKVFVQGTTADGWSRVSTPQGQTGYVQSLRVTTDLPDPGATLIKVSGGLTAIAVAERSYKALVKPGQDLRYYVNVLEYVDRQRGTGAFQGGQALKAGNLLWVPGPAMAQSLVGKVGSGSITGGVWAEAKNAIGNGPGANILRSVVESPQFIGEVLGELWAQVKEHWAVILGTTVALVGAELLVGALAAAPEPTRPSPSSWPWAYRG